MLKAIKNIQPTQRFLRERYNYPPYMSFYKETNNTNKINSDKSLPFDDTDDTDDVQFDTSDSDSIEKSMPHIISKSKKKPIHTINDVSKSKKKNIHTTNDSDSMDNVLKSKNKKSNTLQSKTIKKTIHKSKYDSDTSSSS